MKASIILFALPALAVAMRAPIPGADALINLAVRQQATATPIPTVTNGPEATAGCASAYTAYVSSVTARLPPYPSALESFYSEVSRTATTDYVCATGSVSVPPALNSLEVSYARAVLSELTAAGTVTAPPQCTQVWNDIVDSLRASASSVRSSCESGAARATATSSSASISAGSQTLTATVPVQTAAAGRNAVSAGLAVGAAAVFGYFGLV